MIRNDLLFTFLLINKASIVFHFVVSRTHPCIIAALFSISLIFISLSVVTDGHWDVYQLLLLKIMRHGIVLYLFTCGHNIYLYISLEFLSYLCIFIYLIFEEKITVPLSEIYSP